MELDHGERKRRADEKSSPEFFYTYILQFEDDGTFYVGSTNNPAARWTVDPDRFASKGKNTPLAGVELTGRVVATVFGGRLVHEERH